MNHIDKRTRFTPYISFNRVLGLNYVRKLTRPSKDCLTPSYANRLKEKYV